MIEFITGTVVEIQEDFVVVKCGGIGYGITASATTISRIKSGETIKISTYLNVKDDSLSLFGFYNKREKDVFLRLITVSGIGPKMAITVLSGFEVDEFVSIVINGEADRLCTIKGVGKKTAQRIVLELKDTLTKEYNGVVQATPQVFNSFAQDAISALMGMGFSRQEAEMAVSRVQAGAYKSAEEIIIAALKGE